MLQNVIKNRLKPLVAPIVARAANFLIGGMAVLLALDPEQIARGEMLLTALFLWFIDAVVAMAAKKGWF